ncbi:TetR/AcrR family transcriptional regulator [Fodinisporobacter ferrooxydans]|uniref:TetR/AcrR family transcriptional regulator n=1 Tax=Fodinisporobacter ferrooxydans TaxID=2901836 RepID=A0ABY4CU53_9BACL|nr:TetR/AcrR family transcriptional regulator [Alicyclobacillaceae bacterium MYW30-H2]
MIPIENRNVFDSTIEEMLNSLKSEQKMTEKQRRILQAAVQLFAEKGFHASSTSEIAKKAEVAEGTIFRHFKTKKDLLYALVAPMFIKFATPMILKDPKRIIGESEKSAALVLEELFANRFQLFNENWPRIKIILQEAQIHPEIMEALIENIARQARILGGQFVQERMQAGEFRELPIHAVTRAIFSTMLGYLFFAHAFPEESDEKTDIQEMVDILLHGIKKTV